MAERGRSSRCIRWSSSMRCASRSAMRASCGARPCIWRWRCSPTARATSSALDRADRRRQVLAESLHRPEDAGLPRHSDRRHRRPERHDRGDRGGVSGDHAPDLPGASDPPQPRLRELERSQAARRGPARRSTRRRSADAAARRSTRSRPARGGSASRRSSRSWRRAWTHVIPFFAFPPEVRRVIYTTNALESVQRAHPEDHQDPRALSRPTRPPPN